MRFFENLFLFYLVCGVAEYYKGRILPEGNIFATVGRNLVLKCICDSCNFSSGKVRWTFNKKNYISFNINTTMTKIEFINLNLTIDPKGDDITCIHNTDMINAKTIFIGNSPQELRNIQVIVMDMESLNITWEKLPNHKKIESQFIINNSCRNGHELIGRSWHNNSFYWFITNITSNNQTICLIESNKLGNASTLLHINLTEHVHLSRPKLHLDENSSYPHNITLTWTLRCQEVLLCNVTQVIHDVTYYEENNSMFKKTISTAEFQIHLTNLKPYTEYIIEVKSRMGFHWSEIASLKYKTSPDVPGAAPTVVNGNFYYNATDGRTVIYWKKLEEYKNGPGIMYQLTLSSGEILETNETYKSLNLYPNTSVMLTAKNSVGLSRINTNILINKSDIYPVLNIGVLQTEKITYIFWDNISNVDSYSVFWWNKKDYLRNDIQWKLVYNVTNVNCNSCSDIFVSANQRNSSSGMQKQSCTYSDGGKISLWNMSHVINDSSSITVSLSRQSCNYVFFNKVNISCNQEYVELEIQRIDMPTVTFKNLKSSATYHLKIVAVPRFDNPNRVYMIEYNIQMPKNSFLEYIAVFVVFSTLLVLALISFSAYRIKKKITTHFEVKLPEGIQDFGENADEMISDQSQKSSQMPLTFSAEYSKITFQESDNSSCEEIATSSSASICFSNCDEIDTSSSASIYFTNPDPPMTNYIAMLDMKSRNTISDLEKS